MNLQGIKVSQCYESETNPRGADFEGPAFKELVASVKEKGVLVPVLARSREKAGKKYEIVAGNRRFRAAKAAGLDEIPAQLQDMTDDEAQEAQIVENLQRADVHPLEEGEAYRKLIEDGGRKVADVAVKVGKSETYVRGRLFLTNLAAPVAKAYRSGQVQDAFAMQIARLSPDAQTRTLKYLKESYGDIDLGALKLFITREFSNPLGYQPWIGFGLTETVGPCKECPPNREDLFGKVKEGQCTDLRCWDRKMTNYLAWKKKREPELALVTTSYGKADRPGVLSQSNYELLGPKAKSRCEYARQGLVVEGSDIGTTIWLCSDSECKRHHARKTEYAPTPKERATRKKEIERERAKELKQYNDFVGAIKTKVTWPLSEHALGVLLDEALAHHGFTSLLPIARRLELKSVKEKTSWGGTGNSYKPPLRAWMKNASKAELLHLYFELKIDHDRAKAL